MIKKQTDGSNQFDPLSLKKIIIQLWKKVVREQATDGAASLAYFFMLAIFPGLIFLLSIFPYLSINGLRQAFIELLSQALPSDAANLFIKTITKATSQKNGELLTFGAVFTIWTASSGMHAIIAQMNIIYQNKEKRPYWRARLIAIGLTFGFGVLIILAFSCIVLGDAVHQYLSHHLGLGWVLLFASFVFRWLIILGSLTLAFALIDYFSPTEKKPYRFLSAGSCLASSLFVIISIGFKRYVENFSRYDAMYGSIGAIIVLMIWLYLIGWMILLGATLNSLKRPHPSSKL